VGSVDRYLNSRSRFGEHGKSGGTIRDHVRRRWNQTEAPGSPTSFYGVLPTADSLHRRRPQHNRIYDRDPRVMNLLRDV